VVVVVGRGSQREVRVSRAPCHRADPTTPTRRTHIKGALLGGHLAHEGVEDVVDSLGVHLGDAQHVIVGLDRARQLGKVAAGGGQHALLAAAVDAAEGGLGVGAVVVNGGEGGEVLLHAVLVCFCACWGVGCVWGWVDVHGEGLGGVWGWVDAG